ncbi:hypothetical protein T492DRAFT_956834 [Pavlovales sp. CCMP2436]|nr:hypothetical protein T492DRAFT_956834 [Pavlovales sp. CCMP2436]|mmetsp:Transcript_17823/g.42213  ORF Transcript_17823/g.42213 Transcript_17823/m.42213 type:complete len:350 (-) Transcript_17823:303-1352(-)
MRAGQGMARPASHLTAETMAPKTPLANTSPTLFSSPVMLVAGLLSATLWSVLGLPLIFIKGIASLALAPVQLFLTKSQYKGAKVEHGDGYALVTGASSGIGADIARDLARRGFDLIIVARRVELLETLAVELSALALKHAKRKIDIKTIARDLSKPEQVTSLCTELADTPVVILVNNAGFGGGGFFCEQPFANIAGMVEVNVRSLTELTHFFLQDMVRAGRGHVLQVASIAAFAAGPGEATYHATKAYVLSLSDGLNYELRATGVSVTSLCPGPVATPFFETAGTTKSLIAQLPLALSSEYVANAGLDAMFARRPMVIPGISMKLMYATVTMMPRLFAVWFNAAAWSEI